MTSVQLKDLKGKAVGQVSLDESIFNIEPNVPVLHQALHRQLANARSGSASTLTRSEVRGGGRKPWRQKGTGRARAGSIRSPLWAGGGVIFGPKPRDYSQSMPKKARQLALRSALAARREQFIVVENFDGLFKNPPKAGESYAGEQPKTKQFKTVLQDLGLLDKHVLLLLDINVPGAAHIERAARNLENVEILYASNLNVKNLIEAEAVLTTQGTVESLSNRFKPHTSKAADAAVASPAKKTAKSAKPAAEEEKVLKKAAPASADKPAQKAAEPAKKTTEKAAESAKPAASKPAAKKSPEKSSAKKSSSKE